MKDCERISDLFVEFYDEQMDGETRHRFSRHLSDCPSCREEFKWYGYTITALSNLDTAIPPRDFLIQLNTRLDSSSPSLLAFLRNLFATVPSLPLPAGVGALALIAVLGFVLYNQGPTGIMPSSPYHVRSEAQTNAPQGAPSTMHSSQMQVGGLPTHAAQPSASASSAPLSYYSMASPSSLPNTKGIMDPRAFRTMADRIGADNLTVESPSVDVAIQSLERMLPNIRGRLVKRMGTANGGVVVGVLIPPQAYESLTTELINHGAVEAGAGEEVNTPLKKEDNSVLLYIRFVKSP